MREAAPILLAAYLLIGLAIYGRALWRRWPIEWRHILILWTITAIVYPIPIAIATFLAYNEWKKHK